VRPRRDCANQKQNEHDEQESGHVRSPKLFA
jgi:hypothetical protein